MISDAVADYQKAVAARLGWGSLLIPMDVASNDFLRTKDTIKSYYASNNITAALIIGEDANLPEVDGGYSLIPQPFFLGDMNNELKIITDLNDPVLQDAKPGTVWIGMNGASYTQDVAISLLMPDKSESYAKKSYQIVSALQKFSAPIENRDGVLTVASALPGLEGWAGFRSASLGEGYLLGSQTLLAAPTAQQAWDALAGKWRAFFASGYSFNDDNYSLTLIKRKDLEGLDAYLFYSDVYGSSNPVLVNPNIRLAISSTDFATDAMACFSLVMGAGKTAAEAALKCGNPSMYGDPTLAFKPYTPPALPDLVVDNSPDSVNYYVYMGMGPEPADKPWAGGMGNISLMVGNFGSAPGKFDYKIYSANPCTYGTSNEPNAGLVDDCNASVLCQKENLEVAATSSLNVTCEMKLSTTIFVMLYNKGSADANPWNNGNILRINKFVRG